MQIRASPVETRGLEEDPEDDYEEDEMKMTLKHPDNSDLKAQTGIDRALGWFCTVRERGFDATQK